MSVHGGWQPTAAATPGVSQQYSAGRRQQQDAGASRGRGTGRGRGCSKLPRDVCSRCFQRGPAQCPAQGYRPGNSGRGGPHGAAPEVHNAYGGPEYGGLCEAPPGETYGGLYYGPPNDSAHGYDGGYAGEPPHANPGQQGRGNVQLLSDNGRSETYVDVVIKGRCTPALLDSGCERSVCPHRLCRNAKIIPV